MQCEQSLTATTVVPQTALLLLSKILTKTPMNPIYISVKRAELFPIFRAVDWNKVICFGTDRYGQYQLTGHQENLL